ncbi:SRPBCC family protein [Ilumatobacter sp.]|uniref:SRPBCC family protein n=1 Tax=Ilumatobacter sp. TaxID=1967498 RepID=UPI003B515DE8
MSDVTVSIDIDATPAQVWATIEPIEDHVEWMSDAVAIRFDTDQRRGVGTRFECDTRIGPIRLTDEMEITEWEPAVDAADGRLARDGAMGVMHTGVVTGRGTLHVEALAGGERTRFTWTEDLDFPWFLGGRLGEVVGGKLVLDRVWSRNLRRLRRLVEDDRPTS